MYMAEPEGETPEFTIKTGPTWTNRGLRSQDNEAAVIQVEDFQERGRDEDYYKELTEDDVMDFLGDKIKERRKIQEARNGVLREVWTEPNNTIAVVKARAENQRFFYNMTIFTMGYSIAEVFDIQNVIKPFGVKVTDFSFSSLCDYTNSCASLKLPSVDRYGMFYMPYKQRREFILTYYKLPEIRNASAILCVYPVHICDLLYRTGKPVIFVASNRYELGKSGLWARWNSVVNIIKGSNVSTIAARDNYDARYMDYFTQSRPVTLERHCGYVKPYSPIGKRILLYPESEECFMKTFRNILINSSQNSTTAEFVFHEHDPFKLKDYRSIIYIPHKVNDIKFTEIYRMNIPLFVPSVKLLVSWEYEHHIIRDRVFPDSTNKYGIGGSKIGGKLPLPPGSSDPNTFHKDSLIYWFKYLEYFDLPGVQYFSSFTDLVKKLNNKNMLNLWSRQMKDHNEKKMNEISNKWLGIIKKIRKHCKENPNGRIRHAPV